MEQSHGQTKGQCQSHTTDRQPTPSTKSKIVTQTRIHTHIRKNNKKRNHQRLGEEDDINKTNSDKKKSCTQKTHLTPLKSVLL